MALKAGLGAQAECRQERLMQAHGRAAGHLLRRLRCRLLRRRAWLPRPRRLRRRLEGSPELAGASIMSPPSPGSRTFSL